MPENGIVVAHPDGIRLYHIPEVESVDDGTVLFPVWSWSGESDHYKGSIYDTGSRFPILHIQGSNTHKLEFVLESGFPVVLMHTITKAYCKLDDWQELLMKGRMVVRLHQVVNPPEIVFYTSLVEREDTMGVFRICLNESSAGGILCVQDLWVTDLDEVTGRLLVDVELSRRRAYEQRLWLVDPLA